VRSKNNNSLKSPIEAYNLVHSCDSLCSGGTWAVTKHDHCVGTKKKGLIVSFCSPSHNTRPQKQSNLFVLTTKVSLISQMAHCSSLLRWVFLTAFERSLFCSPPPPRFEAVFVLLLSRPRDRFVARNKKKLLFDSPFCFCHAWAGTTVEALRRCSSG